MVNFESDYIAGAHPKLMQRLLETNLEPGAGYGIAAGMMSSGMGKHVPDTAIAEIEKASDGAAEASSGK